MKIKEHTLVEKNDSHLFIDEPSLKSSCQRPDWLKPENHRFARMDGGCIEVAKAFLSGWEYMGTPDSIEACQKIYKSDDTIDMMINAKYNHIFVTWSVGFAHEDEIIHRAEVADFIAKARQNNIKVTAYISLTNMFRTSMYSHVENVKERIQKSYEGKEMPYGAARYFGDNITRVLACLRNPDWIDYQTDRLRKALETGVDGIYYDNVVQNCYCPICCEAWARYTKKVLGQSVKPPHEPEGHYWGRKVDDGYETTGQQHHEGKIWKLWEKFNLKHIASVLKMFNKISRDHNPDAVFSCNSHHLAYLDDSSDYIITEDGYEPGIVPCNNPNGYFDHFNVGDLVTNKGLYLFTTAPDEKGDRKTFMHDPGRRINGTRNDGPMTPRHQKLAIIEAATYGGCVGTMYEGMFLTNLYRKQSQAIKAQQAIEQAQAFLAEHSDWFASDKPLSNIAVVADSNSHFISFLSSLAIDFNVIKPHQLCRLGEKNYKSLIISSAISVSDKAVDSVMEFVKQGGKVLANNSFGKYNENLCPREKSALGFSVEPLSWITKKLGNGTIDLFGASWDEVDKTILKSKIEVLDSDPFVTIKGSDSIQYHLVRHCENSLKITLLNYADKPSGPFEIQVNVKGCEKGLVGSVSIDEKKPDIMSSQNQNGRLIKFSSLDIAAVIKIVC